MTQDGRDHILCGVMRFGGAGMMRRAAWGTWGLATAVALWPMAAAAQTKTRPVDVIARPAQPSEPANKISANYEY